MRIKYNTVHSEALLVVFPCFALGISELASLSTEAISFKTDSSGSSAPCLSFAGAVHFNEVVSSVLPNTRILLLQF